MSTLPRPTDQGGLPRWTGCPYGCAPGHHEHDDWPPDVADCNYCGALDWSARESLETCWSVCPARGAA